MIPRSALAVALALAAALAQNEPKPEKPDLPYLKHATTLIATEAVAAKPEKHGNNTRYIIAGANSPARTPLAAPIFLFESDKIAADSLEFYRLESKGDHREIEYSKGGPEPLRLIVTRLPGSLYRVEAYEGQEEGEYALRPRDSATFFCFAIY
ncbi:MAG: hypothetical protein ABSH56_08030 [Bryobacteraceae bacterium]|jgi:hypothetical protein